MVLWTDDDDLPTCPCLALLGDFLVFDNLQKMPIIGHFKAAIIVVNK